jgi:hypothetical protein
MSNRRCLGCDKILSSVEHEWCGRRFPVHHIHYDKKNCDPDLITLCASCNSKVNFDRDYWENFFMTKLKELNYEWKI